MNPEDVRKRVSDSITNIFYKRDISQQAADEGTATSDAGKTAKAEEVAEASQDVRAALRQTIENAMLGALTRKGINDFAPATARAVSFAGGAPAAAVNQAGESDRNVLNPKKVPVKTKLSVNPIPAASSVKPTSNADIGN